MQNPSDGVAQPLQNHVHLISGHRFPIQPSLNLEQAFRYLLDAPTIVKQTAPMSWTYVASPPDGQVWLEWIPARNHEYRCASDGYVWLDPEQTYRQEFGGYTIEWMSHTLGYRAGMEQIAVHARTRWHFIGKNPGVNAAPPDPSLWIVHYHQADQNRMIPANSVPVSHQMRQIMTERRWLEGQGRLDKRDFMLHDREHWPTIQVSNGLQVHQAGAQHGAQHGAPQHRPSSFYPRAGPEPPAKRARMDSLPGARGMDLSIEVDEDTSTGDFFDHLTPREISIARFMQHHRWMEEVFSSPYASNKIVPPDLGLGLMGELKGLTDGILDPPSLEDSPPNAPQAKEVQPFTNLKQEQVDEFNRRVTKHLEEGQAEIEKMKKEHAKKMAGWKKTKSLMQAEKRLRYATWEGHETAMRLDVPSTHGHLEEDGKVEYFEDVVKDVEELLGVKVKGFKDAELVEKGGLLKEEEEEEEMQEAGSREETQRQDMTDGTNSGMARAQMNFNQQEQDAQTLAMPPQPDFNADIRQQQEQARPAVQGEPDIASPQPATNQTLGDMVDMEMGDTSMMEDMDMDVDDGIEFVEHSPAVPDVDDLAAGSVPELPPQPAETGTADDQAIEDSPAMFGEAETTAEHQHEPQLPPIVSDPSQQQVSIPMSDEHDASALRPDAAPAMQEVQAEPTEDTTNIFDDPAFDDLADMPAGDDADIGLADNDGGLIDFGGGDAMEMGMEESAFGDALHGMDMPGEVEGDGGNGNSGTPGVLGGPSGDGPAS